MAANALQVATSAAARPSLFGALRRAVLPWRWWSWDAEMIIIKCWQRTKTTTTTIYWFIHCLLQQSPIAFNYLVQRFLLKWRWLQLELPFCTNLFDFRKLLVLDWHSKLFYTAKTFAILKSILKSRPKTDLPNVSNLWRTQLTQPIRCRSRIMSQIMSLWHWSFSE